MKIADFVLRLFGAPTSQLIIGQSVTQCDQRFPRLVSSRSLEDRESRVYKLLCQRREMVVEVGFERGLVVLATFFPVNDAQVLELLALNKPAGVTWELVKEKHEFRQWHAMAKGEVKARASQWQPPDPTLTFAPPETQEQGSEPPIGSS